MAETEILIFPSNSLCSAVQLNPGILVSCELLILGYVSCLKVLTTKASPLSENVVLPVPSPFIVPVDFDDQLLSRKTLVPQAKAGLEKFKMEAASEVGVNLSNGYNGHLTSKEAGSVGGQMVKKMVEAYENGMK